MALLLLLLAALLPGPACSSLYGSRFLAGALGGSITHQCFYSPTPANEQQRKFWCKVAADGLCYTIVSSSSAPRGHYRGRVALGDAPQNGTLTVTMAALRASDSGTYRCGIGSSNHGLFTSLNLTVLPDATVSRPTQLIRGELHGSVTVLCPPGDTHSAQKRFWCKVGRSSCALLASSDGYVGRRYQGRVVLTAPDSSGAFRVLMNDLREEDSGLYLCGTQGPRGRDSPQEVLLQVAAAPALPRRPKFLSGALGGSLSLQCQQDPAGSYRRQYLCRWERGSCAVLLDLQGFVLEPYRGRLRVSARGPGSFTALLGPLREEDAGWYWCGASSGRAELTAPLQLLLHKGTCSSQDPGTSTPVRPTAPSPAAQGTARHGMGTATGDTSMGIVTRDTSMGIVTQDTSMGTVPKDTSMGIVTQDISMGIVTQDTSMGTATGDTSMGIVTRDISMGIATGDISMGTVTRDTSMGTVTGDTSMGIVTRDTTMASVTQDTSMGTVTGDTSMGTVTRDTTMASVTQDTSMGTVTQDTSMGTVTGDTTMGTVTQDTSMGTVTQDTTMGTVPRDTMMASVTQDISMGTVTRDTTMASVTQDISMGIVLKDTPMGTATHSSSSLLPAATSATPGPSPSSPGEAFQESSSAEPRLLPVLLPALLLLICFTTTILTLAKIQLQKQRGQSLESLVIPG